MRIARMRFAVRMHSALHCATKWAEPKLKSVKEVDLTNDGERSFQEKRDVPAIYTGYKRTHTKNYSMENKKGTRFKVNKLEKCNTL